MYSKLNFVTPIIGLLLFVLFINCSFTGKPKKIAQQSPKDENLLLGNLTIEDLLNHFPQCQQEIADYQPDSLTLQKIKACNQEVEILFFLGTWCPDSRREVPRFLKILQLADNPRIHTRLLGLDRSKRDKAGLAEKYDIQYVPTFIVLWQGEEVGRIVETPVESLERDLVEILKGLGKGE